MNKDSLNLRLVGYPDFFNELNWDSFDLNYYFWYFIFSDDVLKLKILNNLSVNDKNNLIFIFKNIKLTYNIFLLLSKKDLQVYHIFFAYHIINELLNILNKYLKYEKIKFYWNIEYSDNILNNIEDSFFYKFLDFNKIKFLDFNSDIVFKVNIKFSSQFYQLKILQYFYVKNNK